MDSVTYTTPPYGILVFYLFDHFSFTCTACSFLPFPNHRVCPRPSSFYTFPASLSKIIASALPQISPARLPPLGMNAPPHHFHKYVLSFFSFCFPHTSLEVICLSEYWQHFSLFTLQ